MAKRIRINLFVVTVILLSIGVVMIYSVTSIYAAETVGDGLFFFKRQLLFILIGILLMASFMSFNYRKLQAIARPLVFLSLALLILVLIPGIGKEVSGARRWFRLLGLSFQPSELSQLIIIIYIADFLSRKKRSMDNFFRGLFPPLVILGATSFLILLQPDLGTAFTLSFIGVLMLFVGGANLKHVGILLALSAVLFYVLVLSEPYRRVRILAFLNPWADPQGTGFQIIQAQYALGSGGLFGVGLGLSKGKLFYLPAAHTDFIFSIIGEELGLLGTLTIVWLYIVLFVQSFKVMRFCREDFGRYLVMGITFLLGLKAVINISVNLGLLPTKGLPLPFISYGGTSLILDMVKVALILNVSYFSQEI